MQLRVLLGASALLVLRSTLLGQTGVGQIQGTVTDASRAVVPQAVVTLEWGIRAKLNTVPR